MRTPVISIKRGIQLLYRYGNKGVYKIASIGYVESLLGAFPTDQRKAIQDVIRYILRDMRFGRLVAEESEPSMNFAGHFYPGTTAAGAGDEFTIAHSFGNAPYLALPVLDLQTVGSEIVPLQVTRAADSSRIYLASSETSVPFQIYIEG